MPKTPPGSTAEGKVIDVTCLILVNELGRFLATQRPPGKSLANHWEFPGGKVDAGEHPETGLRREIREELRLEVGMLTPLPSFLHVYDFATIRLLPFLSRCEGVPGIHLVEHVSYKWVTFEESRSIEWAPADLPVLDYLKQYLTP